MTHAQKVLEAMRKAHRPWLTTKDLESATGLTGKEINSMITLLLKRGEIVKKPHESSSKRMEYKVKYRKIVTTQEVRDFVNDRKRVTMQEIYDHFDAPKRAMVERVKTMVDSGNYSKKGDLVTFLDKGNHFGRQNPLARMFEANLAAVRINAKFN